MLVTGPVDRDEHWHNTTRMAELKLDAETEPLTYHNAAIQLRDRLVPLSFDQQKQSWLQSLRFNDGASLKEISYGNGRIFWAAYPVELAEGAQAAAELYAYVAGRLGVAPMFDLQSSLSPGVMVYPVALEDSVLYIMTSESADDAKVDLRDKLTGVRLTFQLAGQHAAVALIGRQEKGVVAKYGF